MANLELLKERRTSANSKRRTFIERAARGDTLTDSEQRAFDEATREVDSLTEEIKTALELQEATQDTESRTGVRLDGSAAGSEARYGIALAQGEHLADLGSRSASEAQTAKYLRSFLLDTNEYREMDAAARAESRSGADAQSESTNNIGGFLVPVEVGAPILDTAIGQSALTRAGMQTVPMNSKTLRKPTLLTIPAGGWRAEHAAIAVSRATFGEVTFAAKTWAVAVPYSRELLHDSSPDVDSVLVSALTDGVRKAIEDAGLYGDGTGGAPTGLFANSAVTKVPIATNGAAPTYDALIDSAGRIQDAGFPNVSFIYSGRTARALAKTKDSANNYLSPPAFLADLTRVQTEFVPNNKAGVGTGSGSNNASHIFTGDFSQYAMGVNTSLEFTRDATTRMVSNGEILLIAWLRVDFQVLRPAALEVVTGVL